MTATFSKKYQISDDMFSTVVEAQNRAFEIGLDGKVHAFDSDAGSVFMPGETHDQYMDLMRDMAGEQPAPAEPSNNDLLERAIGAIMTTVLQKTQQSEKQQAFAMSANIVKANEEQRIVYGWASVISKGGEKYYDEHGHAISVEVMEKMANDFMADVRVAKAMHDGGRIGQILHSLPLSKQLADALGIESPNEGWIIGVKIMSDEVWKSIKDGKLKAFSVGGWARMQDA